MFDCVNLDLEFGLSNNLANYLGKSNYVFKGSKNYRVVSEPSHRFESLEPHCEGGIVRYFIIHSNNNGFGLQSNAIKDLCPLILYQLVIGWIGKAHGCISNLIPRRLLMNSREERSRLLSISRYFGSDCYILRDRENLEKFDAKSDKGYFLGYYSTSRAYRMYNLRTKTIMESSNVVINDEVCPEVHSENTALVQDKPMEVDDSLPVDYVGKHNDQELMVLNDAVFVPSSPKPSTPVQETQQAQHEFSPSSE